MNPTYNPNAERTTTPTGYMFGGKEYVQETRTNADGNQYKVDVLKGSAPAPNVSTTTVSNENKINQAKNLQSQVTDMSKNRGAVTDGETVKYADGSIFQDTYQDPVLPVGSSPIYGTVNGKQNRIIGYNQFDPVGGQKTTYLDSNGPNPAKTPEEVQFDEITSAIKASTDAQTARAVSAIENKFKVLREQQKQINDAQAAGVKNALLTGGVTGKGSSAQYAPISSEGIVTAQLNYGLQKIAELDAQELDLINEAQSAGQAQNFKLLEKKLAQVEAKREEKAKQTAELNKKIAEQNEKAREKFIQATTDSAIADLYASGVTDTASILKELKKAGMNVSAQEVSSALKNSGVEDINKVASLAAQNGAPLDIVAKIGQAGSVAEANALASGYLQDPLETAYKKAQIAKIYSDIEQSNVANAVGVGSASELVAYAQQYAATGQIPSGLPKGSFGVISQVAKELPKQKGEIVSAATGIKPTGDGAYVDSLANLSSVVSLGQQLKDLNTIQRGLSPASPAEQANNLRKYTSLRSQIIDLLSRARSGAALTVSEEKRYSDMLPTSSSFNRGFSSEKDIDNFVGQLTSDLTNKASAKGLSIYGVSKIDIGGDTYTVGDIVDNGEQKGRINPDGSITIIE